MGILRGVGLLYYARLDYCRGCTTGVLFRVVVHCVVPRKVGEGVFALEVGRIRWILGDRCE